MMRRLPSWIAPHRSLLLGCCAAATVTVVAAGFGVDVRAANIGAAAVDEPQYLLSALSLFTDGDLNIADERAAVAYEPFHGYPLPVQSELLPGNRRISPHDPLLPLVLAVPMGVGGYVAVKWTLVALAGVLAALTTYLAVSRFAVPVPLAAVTAAVAGGTAPLVVYAHQVYPELPAALAVVVAVLAIAPKTAPPDGATPGGEQRADGPWGAGRIATLVLAVTALPWLAVKYALVAAALALVGLHSMWRSRPSRAGIAAGALAVSGVAWLVGHQLLYGGWTAYATGDHFTARGEFSAVGFAPDYLGRSVRLIGLLADSDFGLLAWQPAWLLGVFAVGAVAGMRHWVLAAPVAAGWVTATFVALTMHGFWWPGRQVVVICPLIAVACAVALHRLPTPWRRPTMIVSGAAAVMGVAYQVWLTVAGRAGSVMWVLAPDDTPPQPLAALRLLLPDYRDGTAADWALHGVWAVLVIGLVALGARAGGVVRSARATNLASSTPSRTLQEVS